MTPHRYDLRNGHHRAIAVGGTTHSSPLIVICEPPASGSPQFNAPPGARVRFSDRLGTRTADRGEPASIGPMRLRGDVATWTLADQARRYELR